MEEARTNLFRYSQELSNVSSELEITDNATVSPDGTQNASLCVPTSVSANHFVDDQSAPIGTDYGISCFAKYGSGSYLLAFRGAGIGSNPPRFDLQTGTVVNEGASSDWSNTKIEDVGNGWYRCSSVGNPQSSTPPRVQILGSDTATTFIGDGTGHYIWGFQVEQGSFPTSYIPTSGSAVTRAADRASLEVSEFGYNQDQGTVVVEYIPSIVDNDVRGVFELYSLSGASNRVYSSTGNTKHWFVKSGGATVADFDLGTPDVNQLNKISGVYKKDDFAASLNGQAVSTDTSGDVPVGITKFFIGQIDYRFEINGHIKSVQYYPLRLSNAQLQALTV